MNRRAFTLTEVLVALGIAGLLLVALAGFVRSARGAAVASETSSEAAATIRLASELLREELLLAGSAPWPLPTGGEAVEGLEAAQTAAQFLAQGLEVHASPGGHALRLVYIDDRVAGRPVARQLAFEAAADGQGNPQLYRRSGSSPRQPWVAGVEAMTVVGAIGVTGELLGPTVLVGNRLRGLWLELRSGAEVASVLLELPHRPLVVGP
ncbi:MAG: type II secretion system protein [Trueperaceae bacterium]